MGKYAQDPIRDFLSVQAQEMMIFRIHEGSDAVINAKGMLGAL